MLAYDFCIQKNLSTPVGVKTTTLGLRSRNTTSKPPGPTVEFINNISYRFPSDGDGKKMPWQMRFGFLWETIFRRPGILLKMMHSEV
ncbi:hypothetical protein TNCV_3721631 [Trichonephila clavipes]|nr:hypothetical protein TNCV_3721631 [Trichonephila clavipes]